MICTFILLTDALTSTPVTIEQSIAHKPGNLSSASSQLFTFNGKQPLNKQPGNSLLMWQVGHCWSLTFSVNPLPMIVDVD